MFEVESGVPLPKIDLGKAVGRPSKYPWRVMKVGDSFLIPHPPKSIASMACIVGRDLRRKFAIRKVNGGQSVRVWRVE